MKRYLPFIIGASLLLSIINGYSQPGTLDNTFANAGKLIANNGIPDYTNTNIALQTDGKIVIAGYADYIGPNGDFVLARYNTNGSLDNTFSGDGLQTTDMLGNSFDIASKVIVLPGTAGNQKILVGGYAFTATGTFVVLARYNSDGTLDNSFDGDGKVSLSVPKLSSINGMVIQSDNKIVLGGDDDNYSYILIRFDANGVPDNTFGTGGIANPVVGADFYLGGQIAIQADNKVVIGGTVVNSGTFKFSFGVTRYTTLGAIDNTFDTDGTAIVDFTTNDEQLSYISVQSSGNILISGYGLTGKGTIAYSAFARLTNTGAPDNTFDADGKFTLNSSTRFIAAGSHITLSDNKILCAGFFKNAGGNFDFALLKLNATGGTDNTFDGDGIATSPANNIDEFGFDILLQTDGKILLGGSTTANNISMAGCVARFSSGGVLDNSFDTDGITITPNFGSYPSYDEAKVVKLQTDGKIIIAGTYSPNGSSGIFVSRYSVNGTLDNSFGPNTTGRVFKLLPNNCELGAMQMQTDGKIVITGSIFDILDGEDIFVLRLNANGTPDNTFGTNGMVKTDLLGEDFGLSMALQSDNKVVITGYTTDFQTYAEHLLLRYNVNGTLDAGFGTGGIVQTVMQPTTLDETISNTQAIAIQNTDGKIIIIAPRRGTASDTTNFGIRRYNTNGTPDVSFNSGNIVSTDFNGFIDIPFAVAVQADGKIVVAGEAGNGTQSKMALARYTTAGALDNMFDGDGKLILSGSGNLSANSLTIMPDTRIVAGGYHYALNPTLDSFYTHMVAARLNTGGVPDANFGKNGVAIVDSTVNPRFDFCNSMAVQTDGKVLLAGSILNGGQRDLAVYRLNGDFPTRVISPNSPLHMITVNPNPVKDKVFVWADGLPNGRYQYNITTMDGKLIASNVINVTNGQIQQNIAAAAWPTGVLLFSIGNNKESKIFKLVKQ